MVRAEISPLILEADAILRTLGHSIFRPAQISLPPGISLLISNILTTCKLIIIHPLSPPRTKSTSSISTK